MLTRFFEGDIVTQEKQELVTSTWTNNTNNLTVVFTASVDNTQNTVGFSSPSGSSNFFINVYNADPATALSVGLGTYFGLIFVFLKSNPTSDVPRGTMTPPLILLYLYN